MTSDFSSDRVVLSFAQQQLWFSSQMTADEACYNIRLHYRLRGPLDATALCRALHWIVGRHEMLRATFGGTEGTPSCLIGPPPPEVALTMLDRVGYEGAELERIIRTDLAAATATPFDLAAGPLYRFTLVRLADDDHLLGLAFHRIVADGWSVGLTTSELADAYGCFRAGQIPHRPAPQLTYRDFATTQATYLDSAILAEDLDFWAARLAGLPELDLPADRPRPLTSGTASGNLVIDYPADFYRMLLDFTEQRGVLLSIMLTAAVAVVLGRYTGLDDIAIGVPMSGRTGPELEQVVGTFANIVVLRVDLSGDPSFGDLLDRISEASDELHDHQDAPLELVVDRMAQVRQAEPNPLFHVSVQVLGPSSSPSAFTLAGLDVEWLEPVTSSARFDLEISFFQTARGLRLHVAYPAQMFDRRRIEALAGHVAQILCAMSADPAASVAAAILTDAERYELAASSGERGYVIDAEPETVSAKDAGLAQATPTESGLAEIFRSVLDTSIVDLDANFFELGGNSLHANRIVNRVKQAWGVRMSMRLLYSDNNVRAVARAIDELCEKPA
ncbi:MAG TPA: condensation domain-containing protein [Streptosporangiaceae bacterium]|nr:condensation domain-containing protein [Streptosporangiaceae bacterium]